MCVPFVLRDGVVQKPLVAAVVRHEFAVQQIFRKGGIRPNHHHTRVMNLGFGRDLGFRV